VATLSNPFVISSVIESPHGPAGVFDVLIRYPSGAVRVGIVFLKYAPLSGVFNVATAVISAWEIVKLTKLGDKVSV